MRVNVPAAPRAAGAPPQHLPRARWASSLALAAVLFTSALPALPAQSTPPAPRVTSPKDFFGFNIGDDWKLANYDQFSAYWKKLDGESNRMIVQEIGKTAEG